MLKTKTIVTPSCTLLVCELPEGAIPEDSFCDAIMYKFPDGYVETEYPIESDGSWVWQLINRLPEVTEEQAIELQNGIPHHTTGRIIYRDWTYYTNKPRTENGAFETALESLHSLLESEGVYFENPLGDEPKSSKYDDASFYKLYEYVNWKKAQEQVWDRNRTYIFKQVK